MKDRENEKNVKDGNEEDLEKSNIKKMHKRSKIKTTIMLDLTVCVKAARIERQRVKMLKPQLLSERNSLKKDRVQLKIYSKILML